MSEGDNLFHPVTGSLAAIFLMLLAAGLVGHVNRYHNSHPTAGPTSALKSQTFVSPSGSSALSQQPSPDERKEGREEADLDAQRRMAAASERAVYLSAIALVGLALTVFYARKAWRAAQDSARADNDALALTRTQLAESRIANQAQLRPYMVVQELQVSRFAPGGKFEFHFLIRNIGNTPATEVQFVALNFYAVCTEKLRVRFAGTKWVPKLIIPPSHSSYCSVGGDEVLSQERYNDVKVGKIAVVLAGIVVYRDTFKKRRYLTFRAYINPTTLVDDHCHLILSRKNNRGN